MNKRLALTLTLSFGLLTSSAAMANNAVVGAVLGGGAGALVGQSVGGRDGALIGSALGAVTGVVLTGQHGRPAINQRVDYYAPPVYHAPPVVYTQRAYAPPIVYAQRAYAPASYYYVAPRRVDPPRVYYVRDRHRPNAHHRQFRDYGDHRGYRDVRHDSRRGPAR